jgi:CRISPR-associated protein Csm1
MTQQVHKNEDGEMVCDACIKDEVNGKELPQALFAHISASGNEHLSVLGKGMRLCDRRTSNNSGDWLAFEADAGDESAWHLFRNVPKKASGATMDFDDIANLSPGLRKWLGYLRIDGDGAGKHFRNLKGEPRRIWALSRLLNLFFTESANRLVSRRFTNIYPVYGGGDDLFVIGPWNEVLDFALELRRELNYIVGNDLTFSAGMSLAKPKEHILTQAEFAREQLDSAKKDPGYGRPCGRDQIRALGVTAGWDTFRTLNESAKQVTKWIEDKEIPNSFLHQVLQLHNAWKQCLGTSNGKATAKLVRYKPLLYYQIQRNLKAGKAQDWAHGLLQAGSLWPWADFIARYAMLAAEREKTKE